MIRPYLSLFWLFYLSACVTQEPAPIDFKTSQPSYSQSYSERTVVRAADTSSRIIVNELKHEEKIDHTVKPLFDNSEQLRDEPKHKELEKPKAQKKPTKSIEEELEEMEQVYSAPKEDKEAKRTTEKAAAEEMIVKPEPIAEEQKVMEEAPKTPKAPAAAGDISLQKPVKGKIVTRFGEIVNGKKVNGIDFAAPAGTDVESSTSGTVVFAGNDLKFGNLVIIQSNNSDVFTAYANMEDILVSKNEDVAAGQVIGHVGSTGDAAGPKLHFALRIGKTPVDPMPYLK